MMEVSLARKEVDALRRVLQSDRFLDECSLRVSRPRSEIESLIQTSLSEAVVGIELLDGIDLAGKRVLEVGAGIGIVSLALHRTGIEVVAIEPGFGGFDQNASIGRRLREWIGGTDHPYLPLGAAELRAEAHGLFDVQFSVNVLEHIPDLEAAVAAMCRVLKPAGVMRHTCPNYRIPYEPHFGIPLVPLFPRATAWIMPSIRETELWRSLNFVTFGQMQRAFARHGCNCRFSLGTMRLAFERLEHDTEFRRRQGGMRIVSLAHRLLRRAGMIALVGKLPPALATPMTFEAVRNAAR